MTPLAFVKSLRYTFHMRISHASPHARLASHNGYGYATEKMIESLKALGHSVNRNDLGAEVSIRFSEPFYWSDFNDDHQYKIGYFPWESSDLKEGYLEELNRCDEVWTPSDLVADWFKKAGVERPIYIYEHGVDPIWTPKRRRLDGRMRFLHLGAEAVRKNGVLTAQAFRKAFGKSDDVVLTMKMSARGMQNFTVGNVHYTSSSLPIRSIVNMFKQSHVYIYPSAGEGFGLTPLQALATGMPTITVPEWAPYRRFLDPRLNLSSTLDYTEHHESGRHPGKMFIPNEDDIIDKMRYAYDNYETLHADTLAQTEQIFKEYDWISLTRNAFEDLADRLGK